MSGHLFEPDELLIVDEAVEVPRPAVARLRGKRVTVEEGVGVQLRDEVEADLRAVVLVDPRGGVRSNDDPSPPWWLAARCDRSPSLSYARYGEANSDAAETAVTTANPSAATPAAAAGTLDRNVDAPHRALARSTP